MKLANPITLQEAAELLNCKFVGDAGHSIFGLNEIHVVGEGDLVFVDHPKYYDAALNSAATTILIDKEVECPEGKGLLISDNPFRDFNLLTQKFKPYNPTNEAIPADAQIGEDTVIMANVTMGKRVVIGSNCLIYPGVFLNDDTIIGNHVIIHANSTIGGDAFYYKKRETGYDKMHTCGRTLIIDYAEIGMGCTISRGVTGDTVIGEGSKLDGQIHVGHDTVIGKNCLFAAQVGIAGCCVLEDNVTLWGQVGVVANITIGANAVVLGQSGIANSLEGNKTYFGSPAADARLKWREVAAIRKLPEIIETL